MRSSHNKPDRKAGTRSPARRAALTLGGVMTAHALVETARDGLFLAHLDASQLPWTTLSIAAGTALASAAMVRIRATLGPDRSLVFILWIAALGVLVAHRFILSDVPLAFHFLYVWSGVASSLAVLEFWLGLGDQNTITEGKRRYASIALGGSIGALSGFALAASLARVLPAESLLPISAGIFALSSLGPLFKWIAHSRRPAPRPNAEASASRPLPDPLSRSLPRLISEPYARGVASLLVLSTLVFAVSDYLFKATAAELVGPEELTSWFGTVYLALNLSSTLVLAFLVTPVLRRAGLQRALLALPVLFVLGGIGVLSGGAAVAGIALLKGTEGVFRHSLHRTTSELLFLPFADADRAAAKTFGEVVGDKGAKAAAALAILALVGVDHAHAWLAGLLTILAVAWLGTTLSLRRPYLDVFRRTLAADTVLTRLELPDLDLRSLETLIRALDRPDEKTVRAAITLLQERDRGDLIPSLILYHPAPQIVELALEVFARAGRTDYQPHLERLLTHEDACVRAAATRAIGLVEPDRARLEALARSTCPCIRVSAVAGLLANYWIDRGLADSEFEAALSQPEPEARLALAASARLFYSSTYRPSLIALSVDSDPLVRHQAICAIQESDDDYYNDALVNLLVDRRNREQVRIALLDRADAGLKALSSKLVDADVPARTRLQIPDAVARFGTPQAAEILVRALVRETSGSIRFKILRALGRLHERPETWDAIDPRVLGGILDETLDRALTLVHWNREIESSQKQNPDYKTHGGELLRKLLGDKERLATQRIFMLLDLLHPGEDFDEIRLGLTSDHRTSRASGAELLDNLLDPRRARAIAALTFAASSAERLSAAADTRFHSTIALDTLLGHLDRDRSHSLRAFAAYYAAEIGFVSACVEESAKARAIAAERIAALPA